MEASGRKVTTLRSDFDGLRFKSLITLREALGTVVEGVRRVRMGLRVKAGVG